VYVLVRSCGCRCNSLSRLANDAAVRLSGPEHGSSHQRTIWKQKECAPPTTCATTTIKMADPDTIALPLLLFPYSLNTKSRTFVSSTFFACCANECMVDAAIGHAYSALGPSSVDFRSMDDRMALVSTITARCCNNDAAEGRIAPRRTTIRRERIPADDAQRESRWLATFCPTTRLYYKCGVSWLSARHCGSQQYKE
jgi:hypothetical protein